MQATFLGKILRKLGIGTNQNQLGSLPRDGPIGPAASAKNKSSSGLVYADPILGAFTYDRTVGSFETTRLWNDSNIHLTLSTEGEELAEAEELATAARALWTDEAEWLERAKACAVRELLSLSNEWNEETGAISEEQFRSRIRFEGIRIWSTEHFELWFDDGDLFWGHSIRVSGTFKSGPTDASIQG